MRTTRSCCVRRLGREVEQVRDNQSLRRKYSSEEAREEGIAAGETTRRLSTLQDGQKHYGVMEYYDDGGWGLEHNLTGTEHDNLTAAERVAANRDHGPFAPGVAGYGAERIA